MERKIYKEKLPWAVVKCWAGCVPGRKVENNEDLAWDISIENFYTSVGLGLNPAHHDEMASTLGISHVRDLKGI
jgi:hypothetical protein